MDKIIFILLQVERPSMLPYCDNHSHKLSLKGAHKITSRRTIIWARSIEEAKSKVSAFALFSLFLGTVLICSDAVSQWRSVGSINGRSTS